MIWRLSFFLSLLFSYKLLGFAPEAWRFHGPFHQPMGVVYSESLQGYLVSSVNGPDRTADGNGFISLVTERDGTRSSRRLFEGTVAPGIQLHAPKGLCLEQVPDKIENRYVTHLYVADLNRILVFNLEAERFVQRLLVPGAVNIHSLLMDPRGHLYASDPSAGQVFRLVPPFRSDQVVAIQCENTPGPHAIIFDDLRDQMMAVSATSTGLTDLNPFSGQFTRFWNLRLQGLHHIIQPNKQQFKYWVASQQNGKIYEVELAGDTLPESGYAWLNDRVTWQRINKTLLGQTGQLFYYEDKDILVTVDRAKNALVALDMKAFNAPEEKEQSQNGTE